MRESRNVAAGIATAGVVASWMLGASGACVLPDYDLATSSGGATSTTGTAGTQEGGGGAAGGAGPRGGTGGTGGVTGGVAGTGGTDVQPELSWIFSAGSDQDDTAAAVVWSSSDMAVWAGGSVGGTVTFAPGVELTATSAPDEYSLFLDAAGAPTKVESHATSADPAKVGGVSVRAIARDAAGGFAAAIRFKGDLTLPAVPGASLSTGTPHDVFILRSGAGGAPWVAHLADDGDMDVIGLGIADGGDVIVAGTFSGKGTFPANAILGKQKSLDSQEGSTDVFVVRLAKVGPATTDLEAKWAVQIGSGEADRAAGFVMDPALTGAAAGVWVAGQVEGAAYVYLNAADIEMWTHAGGEDAFVLALTGDGTPMFGKVLGDSGDQRALGLTRLAGGDLVVAGDFDGSIGLGNGGILAADGTFASRDMFVVQLDELDGTPVVGKSFPDIALPDAALPDIALPLGWKVVAEAPPGGGYFVSGSVSGSVQLGSATWEAMGIDGFAARFDSTHAVTWCQPIEGPGNQMINAAAAGPGGSLFLAGAYDGEIQILGHTAPTAGQKLDLFVMKLVPPNTL